MNVTFCDGCGMECEHGSGEFEPRIHIVEASEGKSNEYIDADRNAVSGRRVQYDLCNECYNVVYTAAMNAFKGIVSTESA